MHAILRALQGAQLPGGTRVELDGRFGADVVDAWIGSGLLTPGALAAQHPCPRGGPCCPRQVVANVGDAEYPFVAVPSGAEACCEPVRLTAADVATWQVSRRQLVALLSELFGIRGPANLTQEVFPCTYRLGRAVWAGQEREVLLCTNLNGPAPAAFLLARRAQRQPTLVLAHARTRFTSPDIETHFGSGDVVVVFLEDELVIDGSCVARRRVAGVREPVAEYGAAPYCLLVDADGARAVDEGTYREVVARLESYDLFLDLTRTVRAGRHPTGRREGERFIAGSVTAGQGGAYAELMERRLPLRATELHALREVNHPEKLIEAARRELDVRVGRYDWRSTELLPGDVPEAKRYWFRPPEGLRWVLLRPIEAGGR